MGIRSRVSGWARRATRWITRRPPPPTAPPPPPPPAGIDRFSGPTGQIGQPRTIIEGTFASKSGGKIYAEWNGVIDTDRGNRPPDAGRAEQLAQALTTGNPETVVAALNTIITLDYTAAIAGGAGGFSTYTDTEGLRILSIRSLTITWN